MRNLTDNELKWLDEYIRDKLEWSDEELNVSDEKRMTLASTYNFQVYLLHIHCKQFCMEIEESMKIFSQLIKSGSDFLISLRCIVDFYHI